MSGKRPGTRQWSDGAAGPSLRSVPDLSWMDRGPCTRMDRELFFPPEKGIPDPEARAACERCPISRKCFDYAVERGNTWGYWGGVLFEYGRPVDVEARIRERANRPAPGPRQIVTSSQCDGSARHERTDTNTRKLPGGGVQCLDCARDRSRNYRLRLKEAA